MIKVKFFKLSNIQKGTKQLPLIPKPGEFLTIASGKPLD